ncbi:MAG: acylphosphatase [Alphaproteobacteria bacterium CG_4_10_14_0_2_um_filter_63_37]|nr:MAG: acylphosphatase [Proteobacteria bacterium CG1_02_64_396]PJA25825.1 MAG: acylphosphatase [Alphaproteobacteria bacterium CG_4_10_14_0_2_um_filter_63_37]
MSPGVRAVRFIISGRVQGVWFRDSMRKEAERLGIQGWVRNRPDRSVEAVAQGESERVEALIAWAWQGPPMARVEEVVVEEIAADPGVDGFRVRG